MHLATETMRAGGVFFWGAPTYDQVRIGWNEMRKAGREVLVFTQQRMTCELPQTGGAVVFRSLDDPDNARGHTADRAAFDEVADISQRAFYEVVRPMLIDTNGEFWGVGTPKGRNWFWREHTKAHDRDDYMSWQIPTKGAEIIDGRLVRKPHPLENPDIPWPEIQQAFDTTPIDTFRQEYLAEFLENEGAVFRNILACLNAPADALPSQHRAHRVVMGVDWGKQQDYTALSVGCIECKTELAQDRFNQIDYTFQRARLKVLAERWHVGQIFAEQNAMGDPIIEELQRQGMPVTPFQTTASSKPPLIENMALAFERAEWQFLDNPVWTGELEAYERTISPATGRSRYSAPEGMNDDTVMARALMVWAATNRTEVRILSENPFYD